MMESQDLSIGPWREFPGASGLPSSASVLPFHVFFAQLQR